MLSCLLFCIGGRVYACASAFLGFQLKSPYSFWRLHTFVPRVVILRASTWIFSMVRSFAFEQISRTTPPYSKRGRMKVVYILNNESLFKEFLAPEIPNSFPSFCRYF